VAKKPFDLERYITRATRGPCFVCRTVARDPEYRHHIVYEDDRAIAFLNRNPTLVGYTLVCPKAHRRQVTGDFPLAEYLVLQALVHRIGEAVRRATDAARLYVLCLGSNEANDHVHWHVAPLPHGVPLEEQQYAALDVTRGVLDLDDEAMEAIAAKIRDELGRDTSSSAS
jgi:diadenosine tetraphosphate (Ap4A) HIT family hydrolase